MEEIKQFRENLTKQIEVNKIGCCVGCGLTPEGLDQIISQALQKRDEENQKYIDHLFNFHCCNCSDEKIINSNN